jgi:hypothetical protein
MDCAGIFYSAQAVPAAYALPVFPFPPTTMINAALFGRLDVAFDNGWLRHRTYGGVSIGANIGTNQRLQRVTHSPGRRYQR